MKNKKTIVDNKKTITDKEMELLYPNSSEVTIVGHTFPIRKFSMGQSTFVVKKIGLIIPMLLSHYDFETKSLRSLEPVMVTGTFNEVSDGIFEVVAMCLKITPQEVEDFDPETFFIVIDEIIRVNIDFFDGRVKSIVMDKILPMFAKEDKELTPATPHSEN